MEFIQLIGAIVAFMGMAYILLYALSSSTEKRSYRKYLKKNLKSKVDTSTIDYETYEIFLKGIGVSVEDKAKHLKSNYWKNLKKVVRFRADNKCEICGSKKQLELHHLHYRTLTKENPEDVILLCRDCHQKQHNYYGYDRFTNYTPIIKDKNES